MEKSLVRLVEAATVAADLTDSYTISLHVLPEGVRVVLEFEHDGRPYSLEHIVTWRLIGSSLWVTNPLISGMNALNLQRIEFIK